MPFWSSTCHSDSKEFLLLFTSKRCKINELHKWEYKIFEMLLWLKPSWKHGVSMFLQQAEAETNGLRQWPRAAGPLALLVSIRTVWHCCELFHHQPALLTAKLPLISLCHNGLVLSLPPLCWLLCGLFSKSNCTNSQLAFVELKLLNSHSLGCSVGKALSACPCLEFKILTWISTTIVWWKSFKHFPWQHC